MGEEPKARLTEQRKAMEEWRMELEPKRELVALRWELEHEMVEKKLEMETWLVMRLVRILEPEREPRCRIMLLGKDPNPEQGANYNNISQSKK
nr:hypothetical protein CFP56_72419 [Quercus suber]